MKPKLLLLLFITSLLSQAYGQKQWSNWCFSGRAMLTFNTPDGKGKMVYNYATGDPNDFLNYASRSHEAASYADPTTGEMKFLIGGHVAFDKNYETINSSSNLRHCDVFKYGIHIIPFPSNPNKFYVLQFQSLQHDLAQAETGLQVRCPNAIGLGYSVLDLSLNNGLGNFSSMNNVLLPGVPERISLVRHANGKDVWAVVHSWGDNHFQSYLFTDAGVQPPVVSAIGPVFSGRWPEAVGNMSASHDGKTLAGQKYENDLMELYDFNNNTGVLSNYRTLATGKGVDRIVFSPDDSKLYFIGDYANPGLFQFDLSASDVQSSLFKVADDPFKFYWDMQMGLDGRLYVASVQAPDSNYFSIVNCPNLPKYACNFEAKAMSALNYALFPNFINDYIQQPKAAPVTEFSLGRDTAVCFGSLTLSAPQGWDSYKWNTGETTRQITVTQPGKYFVLAGELGFSCPSAFGSINVTNAAQPLSLGNDTTLCPHNTYTLHVPSNFSNILWSDGTTDRHKVVDRYGAYSLIAKDQHGCTNRDTVVVGFKYYPQADFGKDTTFCGTQSLLLQMQPPASFGKVKYAWQDGSSKDTLRVTKTGLYWGQVTYEGCTVSDTIQVNFINAQNVSLGSDTTLCEGDSLHLQVNASNASAVWSTAETTNNIWVKNSGLYWVSVDNGVCTVSDTIEVLFRPKPRVYLGMDTVLCEKQKLYLNAFTNGASYFWQNGSTESGLTVEKEGTYSVQVNNDGCVVSDSINIQYKPLPILALGNDTAICANETLLLNASNPKIASYRWQDNTTSSSMSVQAPGVYFVSVTGVNGCLNADTIMVSFTPLPSYSLGNDTTLCDGEKLRLSIPLNNASYYWNTGNTENSLVIAGPGIYWVDARQNGCVRRDSISVFYKPLPHVNLGADTALCEGVSLKLDATNPNATYRWQDGSTLPQFAVSSPGVYSVTVNMAGCIASDNVKIDYNYKPRFTLGEDTVMCLGSGITLHPQVGNASLLWQDGSSGETYTVTVPGVYSLTASNECGSFSDEIRVGNTLCQLLMPNAFTPNNDGLNDVFRVKQPGFIKTFRMSIYNRWGEVIFQTSDPTKGWDGKFKGVDQPEGAYVWYITLTDRDGNTQSGKGTVIILR